MKMKALSLAVVGAMGGFAMSTQAQAAASYVDFPGQVLIVPYYTVQNGNATLINVINTDEETGKVVKVRFRGAVDSDDVFDFQLFLSPGDMWTAAVTQSGGKAQLSTTDKSCTLPSNVNQGFVLDRVSDGAQTLEGYVELITMADIPATYNKPGDSSSALVANPLFTAIKHVAGVAPCTTSVLNALVTDNNSYSDLYAYSDGTTLGNDGMMWPASDPSLVANWTIINVPNTLTFSGEAVPLQMYEVDRNLYWRQVSDTVGDQATYNNTADAFLLARTNGASSFDLPDLSTPYHTIGTGTGGGGDDPRSHIANISGVLDTWGTYNEFLTQGTPASLETDWVISMPTRRFMVANRPFEYNSDAPADKNDLNLNWTTGTNSSGTNASSGWVDEIIWGEFEGRVDDNCVSTGPYSLYNREESTPGSDIVISPGTPESPKLCGEVAVISFNHSGSTSGVLGGTLTKANLDAPYEDGWATLWFWTDTFDSPIPAISQAFTKAFNPAASANTSGNYGANWWHRNWRSYYMY